MSDSVLIAHLRSLSPEWSDDTIHLYSPGVLDSLSPMYGRPLTEDWESFFRPFYGGFSDSPDIYAVAWTSIGADFSAFILRVPSLYWPSALSVWVHNDRDQRWLRPLSVADAYGDAGWSFQLDAWLVDRTNDGFRDLVQRRTDWNIDMVSDSAPPAVVADSVYWRFFQDSFSDWGYGRSPLGDEQRVFTLAPEAQGVARE